ncbi:MULTISPECIES: ABC transporter permease [unclassified Hwanghaeella]|jgi:iron(III) transport system permease protein|uniref:ABC transporter permease n=1 Tax=unclassified Hwanghaeella TaxID=2605944 RepID=UPI000C90B56A|nr:iron ABC transporter permease [Rhodospirillales bacterium]|tara:strand:+ start:51249 stop:52949 length:1701 start_codon:yes stop_codon:yes gene_type:complete
MAVTTSDATGPVTRSLMQKDRSWIWTTGAVGAALIVIIPLASIVWLALFPKDEGWFDIVRTSLPTYISNTLILMVGVGIGTITGGVSTAWLVTVCRFPGRRMFEWALLLPLAVPAYLVAFVYTDILEYGGPVQGALRDLFGWQVKSDYWFPEIRSHGGAIIVLSLVLYPYVYMMARAAFLQQSVCALEAARTLGRTPWRCFWTVALPMARPALVIGVSLAMMETLNDFGTIDFFGVHTLTAGVFEVWRVMGNTGGAAQIALVMLLFVVGLLWLERSSRHRQRYGQTSSKIQALPGFELRGWRRVAAMTVCGAPLIFGFAVPFIVLAVNALRRLDQQLTPEYFAFTSNSLILSGTAAVCAVVIGLFMAYGVRLSGGKLLRMLTRLASVGYAVPGAVLAVGVIVPFTSFDAVVGRFIEQTFGVPMGPILFGTAFAVVFAYVARFMAIGFGAVDSALEKVTPHMDDAARTLGKGPLETLRRIHLPMIRGGILAGAILVFVDCMKELPATLILRPPFNFDTLATFVFQYASDEQFERASLGAITIVIAGIIPVVLLSRAIRSARPGHANG